jgi:hypothetical protein
VQRLKKLDPSNWPSPTDFIDLLQQLGQKLDGKDGFPSYVIAERDKFLKCGVDQVKKGWEIIMKPVYEAKDIMKFLQVDEQGDEVNGNIKDDFEQLMFRFQKVTPGFENLTRELSKEMIATFEMLDSLFSIYNVLCHAIKYLQERCIEAEPAAVCRDQLNSYFQRRGPLQQLLGHVNEKHLHDYASTVFHKDADFMKAYSRILQDKQG